jgi:hypothetical protein
MLQANRNGSLAIATFLSLYVVLLNFVFPGKRMMSWDVFGYYLYLPQAVIAKDLRIPDASFAQDLRQRIDASGSLYQLKRLENGNHVMKYSMGMAVLYTPGFFVGHAIAGLTGAPQDGISPPYLTSLWIWCILVSLAGIWLLRAVLVRLFDHGMASLALVLIVFGTNYLAHITMSGQNAMSHNFLFTGYALLMWCTMRWYEAPSMRRVIPLALTAGLMVLARPSELVCLFFPLLWPHAEARGLRGRAAFLARHGRQVAVFAGILILIGIPQFIYWKSVTGHFLYTGYGNDAGEGFNWTRPYTWEVLFGYRKGWFLYTPLMLLAFAGMVPLYFRHRGLFWLITVYTLCNVYWVSAWSCYWYSWCFGQRALIPAMAVMALPLTALWESLGLGARWWQRPAFVGVLVIALGCVTLNILQSRQYGIFVLNGHLMTKEYYWATFLKSHATEEDRKLLLVDHNPTNRIKIPYPELYDSRPFYQDNFDDGDDTDKSSLPLRYPGTLRMYPGHTDMPALDFRHDSLTQKDHCYLRLRVRARTSVQDTAAAPGSMRFTTNEFYTYGGVYNYRTRDLPLRHGVWNEIDIYQLTPEVRLREDVMRVYFRNLGADTVYLDDLRIDIYEQRPR